MLGAVTVLRAVQPANRSAMSSGMPVVYTTKKSAKTMSITPAWAAIHQTQPQGSGPDFRPLPMGTRRVGI